MAPDERECDDGSLPRLSHVRLLIHPPPLTLQILGQNIPLQLSLFDCRLSSKSIGESDIVKASKHGNATQELFVLVLILRALILGAIRDEFHILRAIRALWPKRAGPSPHSEQLRVQILKKYAS